MANMVSSKKLNLDCGEDYKQGWINLDFRKNVNADVKHDLNKFPYPFKENSFEEILLKMILEHLDNPIKVLREVIRISNDNAKVTIIVPHAFSYANNTDIQHRSRFTENSFEEKLLKEYGLGEGLSLVNKEFLFPVNKWKKYILFKGFLKIFFNGIYDDLLFEFQIKK
ncbi:MAG: methyltransferase domain-containing protein [Candidatus Pacearchaeota archaeon]